MSTQAKDPVGVILAKMRAQFGKSSAFRLSDEASQSEVRNVIPFGIAPVDNYVIGVGGIPCGRMTEMFSEEGAGKTSLGYAAIASAQREGGIAILVETENAVFKERAATLGVNTTDLLVVEPEHMEDAIEKMEAIMLNVPSGVGPVVLVWDSLAATPTKLELEQGAVGDAKVGDRSRTLSRACRVLAGISAKRQVAVLVINQVRDKIGVMFGDKTTTPGGHAVKFYASLRLQILGGAGVKKNNVHIGKDVTVICPKNKLSAPWRKVRVRLDYARGWDNVWSTLEYAKGEGLIEKSAKGLKQYELACQRLGWAQGNLQQEGKVDGIEEGTQEDDVTEEGGPEEASEG